MKITMYTIDELNGKTVAELREMCRNFDIPKMSKARKDDVVEALLNFYEKNVTVEKTTPKAATSAPAPDTSKIPYINANLHSFMQKDLSYQSLISVSCGAASSNYPVVGRTVGFIKATYREILNIDSTAGGVVNGVTVEDSYVLKSGDTLEFVRKAGSKG